MTPEAPRRWRQLWYLLAIAGCFALFAWRSWRTWPDVLVDFGHELYIPWRLLCGEALYNDIPFTMGPLSQHVNALFFRAFGVSLGTLIWANLVILAAITVLLYWLFRRLGTPGSATFVVVFFLAVFAFSQYTLIGNYNYVCPYRHEVTHGLALGLAELACLVKFCDTRRSVWVALAGLCLGLVALTKGELFLPAFVTALAGVAAALMITSGGNQGARPRYLAARSTLLLVSAAALPVGIAIASFATTRGWGGGARAALGYWSYVLNPKLTSGATFFRLLAGWDDPWANFTEMLLAALVLLAVVVAGYLVDRILGGRGSSRIGPALFAGVAGLAALQFIPPADWEQFATSLPVLLAIVIVIALVRLARRRSPGDTAVPMLLVAVYALFLLPKILLRVHWSHYGFALAMPGTLLLVHIAIHSLPKWLKEQGQSGEGFRGLAVGVLAAGAFLQVSIWDRIDRAKTMTIGDGGDRFFVDPANDPRTLTTKDTLAFLQRSLGPDDTLAVIPEGATLNYLLRAPNPTGYLMLNPWEFEAHGGEDVFLDAFRRSPPAFIVIVAADMSEHGSGLFGSPQFGARIQSFINEQYDLVDIQTAVHPGGLEAFQAIVYRLRAAEE